MKGGGGSDEAAAAAVADHAPPNDNKSVAGAREIQGVNKLTIKTETWFYVAILPPFRADTICFFFFFFFFTSHVALPSDLWPQATQVSRTQI